MYPFFFCIIKFPANQTVSLHKTGFEHESASLTISGLIYTNKNGVTY